MQRLSTPLEILNRSTISAIPMKSINRGSVHVPFRMCGCHASFKSIGTRNCAKQSSPRPMKPRQSGRTISIRNAKQYKSFHMPTQINLNHEAGCCCDDANAKHTTDQPGQCQVNHHELMQKHRSHIKCECIGKYQCMVMSRLDYQYSLFS